MVLRSSEAIISTMDRLLVYCPFDAKVAPELIFAAYIFGLQGEYLDCHTPICLKLPGAEVGGTVRCPM